MVIDYEVFGELAWEMVLYSFFIDIFGDLVICRLFYGVV